ncbi:hypothetical protein LTR84_009240 [Exophiala bonariae]|uniref:Ketoreductase domain-containing protein n=1 Tax=Exophiala bonariae TaxID=1690606 RepID=A0AAV9MUP4_9EURO|nr:hypothetical protein LTR84_009240 [Exophiala bonariae]
MATITGTKAIANTTTPLRVLVTGGLGFVGSAIIRAFTEQHPEWDLYILDKALRTEPEPDEDDPLDLLGSCKFVYLQADITDEEQVRRTLEEVQPQVVVHTAGMIPGLSERYLRRLEGVVRRVNVDGTRHVVDAARNNGCRALVYTSSCTVVTDDLDGTFPNIDERWPVSKKSSIYGESKAEAEQIVLSANTPPTTAQMNQYQSVGNHGGLQEHSMSTCVLRPSVIFGEGDNQLIPSIHACIQKGETRYRIGDGNNMWDTVYVGNVADAHVLAVENLLLHQPSSGSEESNHTRRVDNLGSGGGESGSAAGETFFIQNNQPIPFRDFSLAIWREFGHIPPGLEIPIPEGLAWILGLVAEAFTRVSGQATTLCRGSVRDACAVRYASGDKARKILGYRPRIGLEAGLKRSCRVSPLSESYDGDHVPCFYFSVDRCSERVHVTMQGCVSGY